MFDHDLATLYAIETKVLNQAVKRNISRFPTDFMFQLSENEQEYLRSHSVTSNTKGRGGRRYPTVAFTELGIAMLSSVLSSEQAVQTNIRIMRMFFELRDMVIRDSDLAARIEKIEKNTDYLFEVILHRLDQLEVKIPILPPDRKKIGF